MKCQKIGKIRDGLTRSIILLIICCFSYQVKSMGNDIDTIKNRIGQFYTNGLDTNRFLQIFYSQMSNGSWKDIKYKDKSNTDWQPVKHLKNLKVLSKVYCDSTYKFFKKEELLSGIEKGLQFWYKIKSSSNNWWWNNIGQQRELEVILLIMEKYLPKKIIELGCKYLMNPQGKGQNKIWFATETIFKGCILNNFNDIEGGLNAIKNEVVINDNEGIQADFSFHQHGAQLYNGGYGLDFLDDIVNWAYLVQGTKFSFDSSQIDIISKFLLDGTRWMLRYETIDYSVMGRDISRKNINADKLLPAIKGLMQVNSSKRKELDSLEQYIKGNIKQNIIGNKYFWCSDFMSDQSKYYYTSVKMISNRTIGTESINKENIKGYWLPFGLTFIYQKGDEYKDIFPIWDWTKLPGVTCYNIVPTFTGSQEQSSSFVGGVTDGKYGAAAMTLDKDSLKAKKSWYYFDDEFVALGAGITSEKDDSVVTTLNQCLLRSKVIENGKEIMNGMHIIKSPSWILQDGIGYIIPKGYLTCLRNGVQKGKWSEINQTYKGDSTISNEVFKLWIDHGIKPKDRNYEYIVFPHTDVNEMLNYSNNLPIEILVNNPHIQAVLNKNLNITEAVFYEPGDLVIEKNLKINVDKPCLVLIQNSNHEIKVSLSNPYAKALTVNLKITSSNYFRIIVFNLPDSDKGGSSITKTINI